MSNKEEDLSFLNELKVDKEMGVTQLFIDNIKYYWTSIRNKSSFLSENYGKHICVFDIDKIKQYIIVDNNKDTYQYITKYSNNGVYVTHIGLENQVYKIR